jgi:capsular polysaccharide transport system permease protein
VQYIGSVQILADLAGKLPLDAIYATKKADWFTRLTPNLPREKQLLYWQRMVHPYFDLSSGIVTVDIRAFSAADAARVGSAVLAATQALVNQMSATARQNALAYASQTANAAVAKLQADETAIAAYRNRYSVLFPELTAQSSTTVGTSIAQQLNDDQANLATLQSLGQTASSPQVQTLRARIAAAQTQINGLNARLAANGETESLASILTGYDTLTQTEQLDAELTSSDLLSLQNARNAAAEKAIYLESFVQPSQPQSSTYPERGLVIAETALAGCIVWILLTLIVNTLRDQAD